MNMQMNTTHINMYMNMQINTTHINMYMNMQMNTRMNMHMST